MPRRLAAPLVALACLLALTGCSGLSGTGEKGYISGTGVPTEVEAVDRGEPIELSGADLEGGDVDLRLPVALVRGVHRVGHLPPGCNLRVVVDARLIDEGRCTGRHHGAFGNQQAAGGSLAVVLGHQRVGHVASVGTGAC